MDDFNALSYLLIPKIREYRTEKELPVILRALRTLYDAEKGDVHKFGSITKGDALLFESESERLAIYDGCIPQLVAVKQQFSKPGRLESEENHSDAGRKVGWPASSRCYWGWSIHGYACMCSLADLIDIKAKRNKDVEKAKLICGSLGLDWNDNDIPRPHKLKIIKQVNILL